jgi:hypothetical protein
MVRKKHDVATRCSWVNDVCPVAHIICGVVKSNELVMVNAVVLKEYKILQIAVGAMGGFNADCCNIRMLGERFSFLAKHCLDMWKQMLPQLWEEILVDASAGTGGVR